MTPAVSAALRRWCTTSVYGVELADAPEGGVVEFWICDAGVEGAAGATGGAYGAGGGLEVLFGMDPGGGSGGPCRRGGGGGGEGDGGRGEGGGGSARMSIVYTALAYGFSRAMRSGRLSNLTE